MQPINLTQNGSGFEQLANQTDQNLQHCYQCGKCTAGCPVAFTMDVAPNQIVRMLQLGLLNETLQTETIWLCASCSTCSARCPKGFDLAKLMDNLRQFAYKQGINPGGRGKKVSLFNRLFLDDLKKYGRAYEMGLMVRYNAILMNPFKDALAGLTLFSQGKLKIRPHRIKGTKDMIRIMENIKRLEGDKV